MVTVFKFQLKAFESEITVICNGIGYGEKLLKCQNTKILFYI